MQLITAVPTHIITGFLGAGKTTLLNGLLAQKPQHEVWAVLVNEFGKIGVDQALLNQQNGITIKEVTGGCLCCTSQLPMQIALVRLLQQAKPDRLFIEPTGLAHADQLIQQLSQSHWQSSLTLHAVVCVVSADMLLDQRYMQHATLVSQLEVADLLVISQARSMTTLQHTALQQLIARYPKFQQKHYLTEQGQLEFALINRLPAHQLIQRQPLLSQSVFRQTSQSLLEQPLQQPSAELTAPYHYVEQTGHHQVAGWCLPAHWQFDQQQLVQHLLSATHWLRIKGVLNTEQGWITVNFTPTQLNYHSHDGLQDNRLEVIVSTEHHEAIDWLAFEQQLLHCQC